VFHWNVPGVQLHFATEPGKLADTVVLSEDLLAISPAKLLRMKMDITIVGGRILYKRHA
jgi:predicted amidohydrolase YtcJ